MTSRRTPGPDVAERHPQVGYTGGFTFSTIAGKPIQPSTSNFTVAVQADCYANGLDRPARADRLPEQHDRDLQLLAHPRSRAATST